MGTRQNELKIPHLKTEILKIAVKKAMNCTIKTIIFLYFELGLATILIFCTFSLRDTNSNFTIIKTLVSKDAESRDKISATMRSRLEKNADDVLSRSIMASMQIANKEFVEVEKSVQPLMTKKEKDRQVGNALWVLAGQLASKDGDYGLATKLLEALQEYDQNSLGISGLSYNSMHDALLCDCYKQLGRKDEAVKLVQAAIKATKVDERQGQGNPGYGEYQYLNTLKSLVSTLLELERPAEAFVLHRTIAGDTKKDSSSQSMEFG